MAFIQERDQVWEKRFNSLDIGIDTVFFVDIIISFISAYQKEDGTIEINIKNIAIKYITGFFAIDIIATLPYQSIIKSQSSSFKDRSSLLRMTRLYRIFRLAKIVRIIKIAKLLKNKKQFQFQNLLHHQKKRQMILDKLEDLLQIQSKLAILLIKFLTLVFFIAHLSACFFYLQATLSSDNRNWIYDQ